MRTGAHAGWRLQRRTVPSPGHRNAAGGYVEWDGALETLGSSIEPRPLGESEELVAFSDFVPAAFDVSSASATVFFAYSLTENDTFVYSSNGVPFAIQ